jgi:signal peptidase I
MISKQAENYFRTRVFSKSNKSLDRLIRIMIIGNSMWPFLRHGQEIAGRKLNKNENYNIGDIVVIKSRDFFLIHRVLFRRKTKDEKNWEYFTKGDRRLVGDGWFNSENIVFFVQASPIERISNCLIVIYSLGLSLVGKLFRRS